MTLQQLKYVVTVAETGTITEAANRLYISQPSLTNAIRELEKIKIVRYNGEKYKLDYAVTKKQKDILAAFGMNAEYVIQKSNKISELLQNELSMKDDLEEEEDVQKENDCFD